MKKLEFPTQYTESVQIGTFETFRKPSQTEPDNALSIPEIIAKYTRGYGIPVQQHEWTSGSAFDGENPEDFWKEEQAAAAPAAPAEPAAPAAPAAPAEPAAPAAPSGGE